MSTVCQLFYVMDTQHTYIQPTTYRIGNRVYYWVLCTRYVFMDVFMVHHVQQSMDKPVKASNPPARGQLNREY